MNNWKVWIENLQAKPYSVLGLLVLIALPAMLILVFRNQDTRTRAAQLDQLEAEYGFLSEANTTVLSDPEASGGKFIVFKP